MMCYGISMSAITPQTLPLESFSKLRISVTFQALKEPNHWVASKVIDGGP